MWVNAKLRRGARVLVTAGCLAAAFAWAMSAQAEPHGRGEHDGQRGERGRGFEGREFEGHGARIGHDEGRHLGWAREGGGPGWRYGHGYRSFEGARLGYGRAEYGFWAYPGWRSGGPFLAFASGPDVWDWRGAWGGYGWGVVSPGFGGWAWGGLVLGAGVSLVVAPPVYVVPPPIYASPPPVVLGLPAIAPPPEVAGNAVAAPMARFDVPSTGADTATLVAASVPPPIVVSPPPFEVAAAAPPVIFAPPSFAFAIAPPALAFVAIGPEFYTGAFFTGGYIAAGYYGLAWERPFFGGGRYAYRYGYGGGVGYAAGFGPHGRGLRGWHGEDARFEGGSRRGSPSFHGGGERRNGDFGHGGGERREGGGGREGGHGRA